MGKDKIYRRLFWVLLFCITSAAISAVVLGYIVKIVYFKVPLPSAVNFFIIDTYQTYGEWTLFVTGSALLTLLFFSIWLVKQISYFRLISRSIQQLSEGQFELDLPVKNKGSLSNIARGLNQVKGQLEVLIEEEKRAIRSKNELITNVSHDLRTPLTSIIGYLRLIEEDQYRDEVELRYFVDVAHEKALRLNRMINDLFEFTKINNREVTIKPVRFCLNELIRQLAAQFTPELRDAEMDIAVQDISETVMLEADPDKLMRVFDNLISNAIKYGRDGKKISLIIEEIDHIAVVKVVNYGEPIPSHAIPLLFDRMYRVEQSRSDATGGTGLGLAIAKGIVEIHQGDIAVTSNEQETIFQVRLPLASSKKRID